MNFSTVGGSECIFSCKDFLARLCSGISQCLCWCSAHYYNEPRGLSPIFYEPPRYARTHTHTQTHVNINKAHFQACVHHFPFVRPLPRHGKNSCIDICVCVFVAQIKLLIHTILIIFAIQIYAYMIFILCARLIRWKNTLRVSQIGSTLAYGILTHYRDNIIGESGSCPMRNVTSNRDDNGNSNTEIKYGSCSCAVPHAVTYIQHTVIHNQLCQRFPGHVLRPYNG